MSEYRLTEEIICRSFAKTWAEAKLEWELGEVYEATSPDECLCGHYPIKEVCVLVNKVTRQEACVGSSCAKKFLGLPSDELFRALKRIRKDRTKSLNEAAIRHAFSVGWITPWENRFYPDIMGEKTLSEKQMKIKMDINDKIVRAMDRHRYAHDRRQVGEASAKERVSQS